MAEATEALGGQSEGGVASDDTEVDVSYVSTAIET